MLAIHHTVLYAVSVLFDITIMSKQALLKILVLHEDLDAASVAHELVCTRAAAGMLLVRLSRYGLIQRTFDPEDRVYFYSLTAKGRARLAYWAEIERRQR